MSVTLETYGAAKKQCSWLSSFNGPLNRLDSALFAGSRSLL